MNIRFLLLAIIVGHLLMSQDSAMVRITPQQYILQYKDAAIADMKKYGVPASITLAQGLFESDCGNSPLANEANNHFGIKCHKGWTGDTYIQDDETANECFRKYPNVQASFDDHSNFLRTRERYASLFALDITDYKGWATGLKRCGYATNPNYAERLIKLIETYQLHAYDAGKDPILVAPVTIATTDNNNDGANTNAIVAPITEQSIVFNHNNIKATRVVRGDTWYKLANQHQIPLYELLKYNDASSSEILKIGDVIYLALKKKSGEEQTHQVKKGDTMRSISQLYGIRLKRLTKYNRKTHNAVLTEGDIIKLRW